MDKTEEKLRFLKLREERIKNEKIQQSNKRKKEV